MVKDALVVGINHYQDASLPNLQAPAQDAEAVAQILENYGEFQIRRIPEAIKQEKPIVGKTLEVSLAQLKQALVQLFKPKGKQVPDTALFYFSGHGLRQDLGIQEGFLATSDVFPDLEFHGLSLKWLRDLLRESPVRQQIIWLDCCYSGQFNFAQADPGEQGQARDRCFIAASREFEKAYEELTEPYSVLTKVLLQGLDPQRCPQQWVTNFSLVDYINQNLHNATQRPIYTNFGQPINLTRTQEVAQAKSERREETEVCPYKGLEYFDCNGEDPKYFYGREKLTDQLLDQVRQNNFLALLGASGSGKSSVLRAGLLHQLQLGQRLAGSEDWQVQILTPGKHPLESLTLSFLDNNLSGIDRASQLDKVECLLQRGSEGLRKLVQAAKVERLVLVIDQFEELFTLCEDQGEREAFCACLLGALSQIPEKLCVILAMRIDFFGKCFEHQYSGLGKKIEANVVAVPLMQQEELRQVVTKPAQKVNLAVEEELVEQILRDVKGSPGSLPLVQYSLTQLWQGRDHNCLQVSKYVQLGGIGGALDKRATEVYGQLTKVEQEVAKHIFLNLTRLGEGTEDTRRRVFQQDLVTAKYSQALVDKVIQTLADEKLVVTGEQVAKGAEMKREAVVNVPHEALIRNWLLLRDWLYESRGYLLKQREIESSASKWKEQGKKVDYLLQGKRLQEARSFKKESREIYHLSNLGSDFLRKSVRQQRINLFKGVGIFFISPLVGTIYIALEIQLYYQEERAISAHFTVLECEGKKDCPRRLQALYTLVRAKKSIKEYNLKGIELQGAYLAGTDLTGAKLIGTNLRGANLTNTNFKGANLQDVELIDANFRGANLTSTNFRGANLQSIKLIDANLIGATLESANLVNAELDHANLEGANLKSANLKGIYFISVNLKSANLEGATLESANLIGANLEGANLKSADLKSAFLQGAILSNADFNGVNLNGVNFMESENFAPSQVKSACNWEKAFYKGNWDGNKYEWVVDEKANQTYIKQLKQDKASDPKLPVDCSRWEK